MLSGQSQQPGPIGGDDVRASVAIRSSAAHVRNGARFENGHLVERPEAVAA
ncbi:hypothetical protein ACFWOL_33555 [Streptomyces sp. NPDC058442]|uniref:Uncharacterized protein n=1 Tax=Streptomyces cathayae TaxID=3031124 RepID=A0ABY8K193_9ACTN|nr:hypothetical protein [Streptomyces sp. HUAS 5]WGD40057.1 hypothetical protein PYS65_07865 [Streptomyces sp. HUAS 5]